MYWVALWIAWECVCVSAGGGLPLYLNFPKQQQLIRGDWGIMFILDCAIRDNV